jgi:hypothetical protein
VAPFGFSRFCSLALATALAGCDGEKQRLDTEARRLCAIDGGARVYEKASLSSDHFNAQGQPQLDIGSDKRSAGYFRRSRQQHIAGSPRQSAGDPPGLEKITYQIVRSGDGKVMGEAIYYSRHGGVFFGGFVQGGGFRCPTIEPWGLESDVFGRSAK